MKRRLAILIFCALTAFAHPLGNFSIGQYAGFLLRPDGITVTYVLDFAEIPSMKLQERWKEGESTDHAMREWVSNLRFTSHGKAIEPFHESTSPFPGVGAGGMSTMMIAATLKLPGDLDELEYEDPNFAGRPGWKEITVRADGLHLVESSQPPGKDISRGLTNYPLDLAQVPHERRARFVMAPGTGATKVIPLTQPPAPPLDSRRAEDFSELGRATLLSQLMRQGELPFRLLLTALGIAFAMGAFHALEPGHGKTLVAAYLVGTRGTWQHAVYLGAITTFTHTFTVFALGLIVLSASRSMPVEQIFPYLSIASAVTIVVFGVWLLLNRIAAFRHHGQHHHGHHHHGHSHDDDHVHMPPGQVTFGSLLALGVSGGLVPCPASLVLLLGAMALGRLPLGLGLLVSFSLGMAVVLTGIGVIVVYAKRWLPKSTEHSIGFHYVAIASAAVMTLIGVGLTIAAYREFGGALGG